MNHCFINYKFFNVVHGITLFAVFIVFISILYNKKRIGNIGNVNKKRIRIIFGIILMVFFILRRGSFIYYDVYTWKLHLDIEFCSMTSIMFIIYCLGGNKKIYNICYYCAFCGPLLSILIPVVDIGINNYSFINFIMIHHVVFLMNIVFAIFEKHIFSRKKAIIAHGFMIMYILACYGFNIIFGTQYNFLTQLVIDSLQGINIINLIVNSIPMNIMVLLLISSLLIMFGSYILKSLDLGDDKNE